jgi:hypothetical protein
LLLADACGVNAKRRRWPVLAHLLDVLFNQLLDMGKHQDPRFWPRLDHVLAQRGDDVRLAAACRHDQTGVSLV